MFGSTKRATTGWNNRNFNNFQIKTENNLLKATLQMQKTKGHGGGTKVNTQNVGRLRDEELETSLVVDHKQ